MKFMLEVLLTAASITAITVAVDTSSASSILTMVSNGCGQQPTESRSGGESWYSYQDFNNQKLSTLYHLPDEYDSSNNGEPVPLVLYFHGWGGSATDDTTSSYISTLSSYGMISVALTGIGKEPDDSNSWNLDSTSTPAQPTCNAETYGEYCYQDCGECVDNCSWTTCQDSVQQTVELLEQVLNTFCIDMTRIFLHGTSNGGMFVHTLANDKRIAPYVAGILPRIGSPHFGFNKGPLVTTSPTADGGSTEVVEPISYLGIWGKNDLVVPPVANAADDGSEEDCRASEFQGWFYTSADCVTKYWSQQLGCDETKEMVNNPFPISDDDVDSCWKYTNCNGNDYNNNNAGVEVMGCITNTNHYSSYDFATSYFIDFIRNHPKPLPGASPPVNPPSTKKVCRNGNRLFTSKKNCSKRNKPCSNISKMKDKKLRKKCNQKQHCGKKLKSLCPKECGEVGVGKCKYLTNIEK